MSIFDKAKHALQHAGNSIKDGAEDAGNAIKHSAEDAGDKFAGAAERIAKEAKQDLNKVEHIAMSVLDDIKHELEKVADDIKSDLEKAGDDILNKAEATIKGLEDGVEKGFEEAKKAVDQIPEDVASEAVKARNAIEAVGDDVKKDLEQFGEDFKKGITEIGEGIEDLLTSEIITEGLQKADKLIKFLIKLVEDVRKNAPEIVDDLNSISGTIEIGPILCNYSGIVDRVEDLAQTLDDYLDGSQVLELTRELVKTLITDLGPDSVRLDLDEEVISRFGFLAREVPLSIFTWAIDKILEEIGVPE